MERLAYRPTEVAVVIGLSRSKVYELIARGEIPSIRLGGKILVPAESVRKVIAEALAGSPAAA
jgi:excisionase family DNA binding protein